MNLPILSLTENPSRAIFSDFENYFYLEKRSGAIDEFMFDSAVQHLIEIQSLREPLEEYEFLLIRKLFFDDKHGDFQLHLDYIYHSGEVPTYNKFEEWFEWVGGNHTYLKINVKQDNIYSDHFHPNKPSFYLEY